MNTAIKIIDEMIYEFRKAEILQITWGGSDKIPVSKMIEQFEKAKERISSLHSLDIDSLGNYDYTETGMEYVGTAGMGEYIRYDDIKKLLQDTLELKQ